MFETYLPLWAFIVLMVSTPGPANLLTMASGAQQGFWKSIPFNIGLVSGKLVLNVAMAIGLATVIIAYPLISKLFAYISAGYIIWLALQGWNAHKTENTKTLQLGFRQGLFVHPLNPKAWVMSLLAFSQFGAGFQQDWEKYALIPLSFLGAQLIFHSLWCLTGATLEKTLGASKLLNRSLILLTIAVVIWAVLQ